MRRPIAPPAVLPELNGLPTGAGALNAGTLERKDDSYSHFSKKLTLNSTEQKLEPPELVHWLTELRHQIRTLKQARLIVRRLKHLRAELLVGAVLAAENENALLAREALPPKLNATGAEVAEGAPNDGIEGTAAAAVPLPNLNAKNGKLEE